MIIKALIISLGTMAMLFSSGCQVIGGGVAGAGYDSIWRVNSAKREPTYISPRLSEQRVEQQSSYRHLNVEELVAVFPVVIPRIGAQISVIPGTDMAVHYRRYRLEIYAGTRRVIGDTLPSVFYMHGPALGMAHLGNEPVFIVCARSRATTGLNFVGIYTVAGDVLFREVIPVGSLREIQYDGHVIDLVGYDSIRRLKLMD